MTRPFGGSARAGAAHALPQGARVLRGAAPQRRGGARSTPAPRSRRQSSAARCSRFSPGTPLTARRARCTSGICSPRTAAACRWHRRSMSTATQLTAALDDPGQSQRLRAFARLVSPSGRLEPARVATCSRTRSKRLQNRRPYEGPGARVIVWAVAVGIFTFTWLLRFNDPGGSFAGLTDDHFFYLVRGWQILFGDLPVRDFVDHGAPLYYYLGARRCSCSSGAARCREVAFSVTMLSLCAALVFWLAAESLGMDRARCRRHVLSHRARAALLQLSEAAGLCRGHPPAVAIPRSSDPVDPVLDRGGHGRGLSLPPRSWRVRRPGDGGGDALLDGATWRERAPARAGLRRDRRRLLLPYFAFIEFNGGVDLVLAAGLGLGGAGSRAGAGGVSGAVRQSRRRLRRGARGRSAQTRRWRPCATTSWPGCSTPRSRCRCSRSR